jgi:Transmembrane protein 43
MAALSDASAPSLTLAARFRRSPRLAVAGSVLAIVALATVYWNEERAVRAHRAFDEGAAHVLHVLPERVDGANEGRVVHLSGTVSTEETLRDEAFGVSAKALRLDRHVEMYLWDESKRVDNGKTEYEYTKRWSPKVIESAAFKETDGHRNPNLFPFEERTVLAEAAHLGAFSIPKEGLHPFSAFEPLAPTADMFAAAPTDTRAKTRLAGSSFFLGQSAETPQVGDVRITFQIVLGRAPAEASPMFSYLRGGAAGALSVGLWLLLLVFTRSRDARGLQRVRTSVRRLGLCICFALAGSLSTASLAWFAYRVWVGAGIAAAGFAAWGLAMLLLRTRRA